MEIKVIRDHLDIVKLQEKMNSIVFDYLDTSNHYAKAMSALTPLYTQVTSFFKEHLHARAGECPKANTYWHLFIDCSAKLCYFLAVSIYYSSNGLLKVSEKVERLLTMAAYSLPGIEQEENEELLTAIIALYSDVVKDHAKVMALKEEVFAQKGDVTQCLQQFIWFVEKEVIDV